VELVKTGYTPNISIASVTEAAFIILADVVMNYLARIYGMHNAFVICLKFCSMTKFLAPLSSSSFPCFPDLSGLHQNFWSESYG
jgi:hypothetical protein